MCIVRWYTATLTGIGTLYVHKVLVHKVMVSDFGASCTHQVDPGLKALGCQLVDSTSLSKLWFQISVQVEHIMLTLG